MSEEAQESAGLDIVGEPEPKRAIEPGEGKKKRKRWLIPVCVLAGFIVLALVAAGLIWGKFQQVLDDIPRDPSLPVDPLPVVTDPGADPGAQPMNFAILGSDSRGSDQGRSDVLMLAHLNAAHDKLYLISFPRDMYVSIPGYGKNKINAAYAFGGPPLTIKTLKAMLDVPINHAATIDFEGFIGLSDAIGGVSFTNDITFTSKWFGQSITFPKGPITLSGNDLLIYCRERHAVPKGDLDRAHHQRIVLKAMIQKLGSRETLTNPSAVLQVADQLGSFITLDGQFTNDAIVDLATSLHLNGSGSIVDLQAPISGFGRSPAGASIDVVDTKKLSSLAKALQGDDMDSYIKDYGTSY